MFYNLMINSSFNISYVTKNNEVSLFLHYFIQICVSHRLGFGLSDQNFRHTCSLRQVGEEVFT